MIGRVHTDSRFQTCLHSLGTSTYWFMCTLRLGLPCMWRMHDLSAGPDRSVCVIMLVPMRILSTLSIREFFIKDRK